MPLLVAVMSAERAVQGHHARGLCDIPPSPAPLPAVQISAAEAAVSAALRKSAADKKWSVQVRGMSSPSCDIKALNDCCADPPASPTQSHARAHAYPHAHACTHARMHARTHTHRGCITAKTRQRSAPADPQAQWLKLSRPW
jgi:hypothetical protein